MYGVGAFAGSDTWTFLMEFNKYFKSIFLRLDGFLLGCPYPFLTQITTMIL